MTAVPVGSSSVRPAPAAPGGALLDVRGLCVDYGEGAGAVRAVVDADLRLRRGEVLGIAGESGSGKSTLAYAVTRLLRPPGVITGGEVWFGAQDGDGPVDLLAATPQSLRRIRWSELAVVFQSAMHALNPVLSIETQLTDVLAAHRPRSTSQERRARASQMLEMVGISPSRLRSYPHELSGGMRQRVMIAMAMILDPQIVIMDEPTTALDVVTQRQIIEEIVQLRDTLGFSVVFITHDVSLLVEIADRIVVMYAGRLVERAPATALFETPRHPYTAGLLSSFPSLHGPREVLAGIPGSPPDLADLPPGCPFSPRCPHAMARCASVEPTLAVPVLDQASGDRDVACFLHDGQQDPPAALTRSASAAPAAEPSAGEAQADE